MQRNIRECSEPVGECPYNVFITCINTDYLSDSLYVLIHDPQGVARLSSPRLNHSAATVQQDSQGVPRHTRILFYIELSFRYSVDQAHE